MKLPLNTKVCRIKPVNKSITRNKSPHPRNNVSRLEQYSLTETHFKDSTKFC